jgi:hypothetical protein
MLEMIAWMPENDEERAVGLSFLLDADGITQAQRMVRVV